MKHNLFYTLLLILLIPCITQAQIRTLFNNEILYGKVRKISSTELFILRSRPDKSSMTIRDTTYFDEKGNTTERHNRAVDLNIYKYITTFNTKSNKLETTSDTGLKKLIIKYDKRGDKVTVWQVSKAGKPYCSTRLKYDDKHNLIEYNLYYESGKMLARKEYLYSDKGFAYEEDNYAPNGLLVETVLYTYSNYDTNGNWTSLEMSGNLSDGKPEDAHIITRQIAYYQ